MATYQYSFVLSHYIRSYSDWRSNAYITNPTAYSPTVNFVQPEESSSADSSIAKVDNGDDDGDKDDCGGCGGPWTPITDVSYTGWRPIAPGKGSYSGKNAVADGESDAGKGDKAEGGSTRHPRTLGNSREKKIKCFKQSKWFKLSK